MSELNKIKEKFILHWGEMGSLWGINRTMAQVHALLFISPEPLCANDIMAELQISRGNVSMALRELIAWGIVNRVHIKGERREFYTTEKDVWTMFRIIARERKKREVDPTIEVRGNLVDGEEFFARWKTRLEDAASLQRGKTRALRRRA